MTESSRLIVLYGSQTFTAQELAERIWRTTKVLGFTGPVQALDDYPISKLIHEELAIFIVATTGQGDEPDNMKRFWKFILRKNLPGNSLMKLKFGVLGLGDSSYSKFNFAGKKLHKRLLHLGATPLIDIGLCDYQHDLGHDAVMTPWLNEFFTKLKQYYPKLNTLDYKTTFTPRWKVSLIRNDETLTLNRVMDDIYFAKSIRNTFIEPHLYEIRRNIRITDEKHFQDVRLISLKTTGAAVINYKPGDIFNIRPRNSKEDIDDLFGIFNEHEIDIKPHYRLSLEECHDGKCKYLIIKKIVL